eukprot:6186542-Pleurochrysis_carterae.AAC.3
MSTSSSSVNGIASTLDQPAPPSLRRAATLDMPSRVLQPKYYESMFSDVLLLSEERRRLATSLPPLTSGLHNVEFDAKPYRIYTQYRCHQHATAALLVALHGEKSPDECYSVCMFVDMGYSTGIWEMSNSFGRQLLMPAYISENAHRELR